MKEKNLKAINYAIVTTMDIGHSILGNSTKS